MSLYQHILIAADLINADDNLVMLRAKAMQAAYSSDLSIIHAIEYPPSYGEVYEVPTMAGWQTELMSSAKERLLKLAQFLNIPAEQQHLRIGQPKYQILEVAETIGADLIIVGSHARHGLGLFLLGSTANAILHHAKCDVLAVRV